MSSYKKCNLCGFIGMTGDWHEKQDNYSNGILHRSHIKFHKIIQEVITKFPAMKEFVNRDMKIWNKELQKWIDKEKVVG